MKKVLVCYQMTIKYPMAHLVSSQIITAYGTYDQYSSAGQCKMNIAVLDVDVDVENIGLAYIPCTLKENSGITLKGSGFYMCFTDLFRTTCALSCN